MDYQYRYPNAILHAGRNFLNDDIAHTIDVVDCVPHITWTDTHQFVILQYQTDKSIYIFTNDNSVTKIPFELHSRKDFDFRECLSEEHGVISFANPDKFARCLTIDPNDTDIGAATQFPKTHRSIIGEFYDKTYSALSDKPKTIHRRALTDDTESNPSRRFTFRNFGEPSVDFYNCWYHPSNKWKPAAIEMFMCYKTNKDIVVHKHDEAFPSTGVMIRPPLAHQCGINSSLIDNSVSKFLFKCTSAFRISSNPDSPTLQCQAKFSYKSIPISHLISDEELDSLLTDVIISFSRAWNLPHYRCRFEFDNHFSQFWTAKPIDERMSDVLSQPNHNVKSLLITNQFRSSQNFPSIKTIIPDTKIIDLGLHLLSTVITTKKTDFDHFDVSTIPTLEFSFVDDMDARDRGFTWFHRHHHYILYMNVTEPNLYAFGNLKINVFIDMKVIDGQVVRAWRRYDHVVRQHVITGTMDLRPIIRQEHPADAIRFTIPGTNVTVHPGEEYPFTTKFHHIEWTPVIIPCHPTCRPPKTLFQYCYNQAKLDSGTIKGVRRSITIRNDFFNNMIRHDIFAVCTRTFASRWKCSKFGPISFLICGSLLDEFNVLDFHQIVNDPTVTSSVLTMTFNTFSPTFGLCGFSPGMIFQFTDAPYLLDPETDRKLTSLPQWPCSPQCRSPPSIKKMRIHDTQDFRNWLSELALNVYKLKYLNSEPTTFKCTINKHAHWRVLTKGRYQTFFCNNFAMFGLNFRLPIFHPKRWAMSYCFTEEELSSLPWTKVGKFWSATLTNAIVTRQKKQFPLYSVFWIPSRDSCVFHLGRLGMAQPVLDPLEPHSLVYKSHFEADSMAMGSLLRGSKMNSITSNTLESMVLKVFQNNKALEYDLLKLSLELNGSAEPNPEDPEWKTLRDRFASALTLDASLTPEASQPSYGVDTDVNNGVDTINTERSPLFDAMYSVFDSDDSPLDTSTQSTSSDSTL